MVAEHDQHRHFHAFPPGEGIAKDWSFADRQPYPEAHQDQHRAREEWDAPAESEELLVGEPLGEREEYAAREEESDRRAELREHAVPGAPSWRCVLDREQHRAAPFAAETEALPEPAEGKKQRRGEANRLVRRQRANNDR